MLRTLVYSIVLLVWATLATFAQATTAPKVGTATVSGKITVGDKPASGIIVGLNLADTNNSAEMVPIARATTDSEGRYQLSSLVAGRYRVQALAPGYVSEAQKADAFNRGNALNLSDGETVENLDFKLSKGGVITGKVTDTNGRPLIAARIQLENSQVGGRLQPTNLGVFNFTMMNTDDRGEYRIYGLPEGRYAVSVGTNAVVGPGANAYPVTYHPETTVPAEAKIITVTPGSVAENVDIRVTSQRRKSYAITARVVDAETGQPVAGVAIGYSASRPGSLGGFSIANTMGTSDARGMVRIEGVTPGKYGVSIPPFRFDGGLDSYYSEPTPVEVADSDVDGVEVRAQRGGKITGRVLIEGVNDPTQLAALMAKFGHQSFYAITFNKQQPSSPVFPRYGTIGRDGSFSISGLPPGQVNFNFNTRELKGFMLVRIESENSAPNGELNLPAGQNLNGVKVILAYGSANLHGQLQVVNGALPTEAIRQATVRRTDMASGLSSNRFAEVDARGRFSFEGLPAGEYEVKVNVMVRSTMVMISSDGSTTVTTPPAPPKPMVATQKVIVPAVGETEVIVTLDVAAQTQPKEK